MGWIKPSLLGFNKNKEISAPCECPWKADCPSHVLPNGYKRPVPLRPKLKLIENVQPHVRKYKCGYCGMVFLADVAGIRIEERDRAHIKNPAYIGGEKVIC